MFSILKSPILKLFFTVFIFGVSGFGGILCMFIDVPMIQIYLFIILMGSGLSVNVINAATVELYPTAVR